jgi:NAD(P)-dependent dehydrogenase (short-subunit alcohol dehydrogenase family)
MNNIDCVIITGAGRGIGKAISKEFALNKNLPVLCISKSNNIEETKDTIIAEGGTAYSLKIDISDYVYTKRTIYEWIKDKKYNNIGLVLAASQLGEIFSLDDFCLKSWDECYKINVLGNLAVLEGVLPQMLKNKFGRIVVFSGGGAAYSYPIFSAYSASKTAVVRTVENLSVVLKDKGDFAIVALAPGAVDTDMLKKVKEAGGEVKTTVDISEPVKFVSDFILSENCNFSGSFVHVRDNWNNYLNTENKLINDSIWKLRRIEPSR